MKILLKFQKLTVLLIVFALFFTLIPAKIQNVEAEDFSTKDISTSQSYLDKETLKERKEIASMRSENSKTYLNPNNTYTTEILETPIHYKDEKEKDWKPIDNTLLLNESKEAYVNKANSMKIEFSQQASPDKELVSITEDDSTISLSAIGSDIQPLSSIQTELSQPEATVYQNEIIYEDLYPNVDVKYTIGSDRVKEDIILKERPDSSTPTNFSFKIDLEGLQYKEDLDGRILFTDSQTQETVFYLEKPFMYDSYKPQGYQENPNVNSFSEGSLSYDVEMKLVQRENQLFVDLIPNREWLESGKRVFPVIIDPTIVKLQKKPDVQDTNIRSHFPNNTGGAETTVGVGLYQDSNQTNKIRSLLKFNLATIAPGTRVIDATVNMRLASVWNNTAIQVDLHQMDNTWTESGATWSKRDGVNSWLKSGGDYVAAPLDSVDGIGSLTDLSINYKWNVSPAIVHNWIHNPSSNQGLLLKATDESVKSWKKFISSDDIANSEYSPVLAVTYMSGSRLGLEDYWTYNEHAVADGFAHVNLGTGNGVFQFDDFEKNSAGNYGISFERTYNSKSTDIGHFGLGWSSTGSESIVEILESQNIIFTDRDGTGHDFKYDPISGKYISPPGKYLNIIKDGTSAYKVVDKFGNITRFKKIAVDYETTGYRIAKIDYEIDRNGNQITYAYGSKGELQSIVNAAGQKLLITQGPHGVSSITFANRKNTYHYTSDGQLTEVRKYKDSTNYTSVHYTYNENGNLENITDANKKIYKIVYENEFIYAIHQPSTSTGIVPTTNYSYDVANYTSNVTDPEGGITNYQMNKNYTIRSVTDPLGDTINIDFFDSNYNPLQITDSEGNVFKNSYDSKGNMTQEIDALGIVTTYTYDTNSNLKTINNSKGTTNYIYDLKGNLTGVIDPEGNKTEYTYDTFGNKTSTIYPDGSKESYSYDALDNSIQTKEDALGRISVTNTDSFGNLVSTKDPKGYTTSYTYDQQNLLTQVQNPNGDITSYKYDNNGNIQSIINSLGKEISLTYNEQNQLIEQKYPMGEVISLVYDENGNVISIVNPTTSVITNKYDESNQLIAVLENNVTKWEYTYDANGNIKTIKDNALNQTKFLDYDANNNLTNEVKGNVSLDFSYNEANEIIGINGKTNNNFFNQSYKYTAHGLLEEIYTNNQHRVTMTYTKNSLPESTIYNNGITSTYTYDKAQQLNNLIVQKEGLSLYSESLEYDANGNITVISGSKGIKEFSYDSLNQLSKQVLLDGTTENYEYDKVGNRTKVEKIKDGVTESKNFVFNGNNQLINSGGINFLYDKNGNRIRDDKFIYEFNEFNELEKVKKLSGQLVSTFTYDEVGRRTSKTENGNTTHYHYDKGINVLFETDDTGNILREYSYNHSGIPLTITISDKTYFYIFNSHGDVIALSDALGEIVASYQYDAWGNIISQNGVLASENPYRYAGYRYDSEIQKYYLIKRYYSSEEGVFLSRDPISGDLTDSRTQNGYSYVSNNPVMHVDPNGEYWKNAWWNSQYFLSRAINWAIIGASLAFGGWSAGLLKKYAKKQLSEAKRHLFAKNLKKQLMRRGVSALVASYIVRAFQIVGGFVSYYLDPGTPIFKYLDSRDRKRKNGYFNGF